MTLETPTTRRHRTRLSRNLGLRARVTATFAIGAFALSTIMAGITYFTARQSFLNERQGADQRQAFANASLIRNALRSSGPQVDQLIGSVDTLPGSLSVLHTGGKWYATSISVGQSAIPAELRTMVLRGTPAYQFFSLGDTPQIVIGVPLPAVHAAYFEVFSLDELASTLRTLAFALAAAALVTTLAGAAVGRWASGRALRPLAGVTDAAVAIAGGQLDTRVEAGDDVDLQELASAFNRMTANLQERIEREARFTSDVSHELRSPLTTLSATVGVLEGHRDELAPGPRVRSTCSTGTCSASPGWSTTCWRSPGSMPARPSCPSTRSTPGSWCAGRSAASAPFGEDGHRAPVVFPVEVEPGVEGLRLRVDKRRFERVMANLMENAALYAGGVTRVVVERQSPERPDVPARTHPGDRRGPRARACPPSERHHLFERFYRGGRAGQRASGEGTGLGLSLVAEHVRLHGGRVWSRGCPGPGLALRGRAARSSPEDAERGPQCEPAGPTTAAGRAR